MGGNKLALLCAAVIAAVAVGLHAQGQRGNAQAPQPANQAGQQPNPAPRVFVSPEVQTHINNAYLLLGKDLPDSLIPSLFIVPRRGLGAPSMVAPSPSLGSTVKVPPTKVFDQLYYLGSDTLGAWALTTSDGIILIDTMNNASDAENIIEAGMKTLGLNPASIKYILITHGHGDHFGGAKYFQDKYKAKVMMGAADWALLNGTARQGGAPAPQPGAARPGGAGAPQAAARQGGGNRVAPPAHDLDIADGQKLVLGNTTVSLYLSPGHTPGSMSAIFPVTDNGVPHTVSLFGGTGIPTTREGVGVYIDSVTRLIQAGTQANADVAISTHPIFDGSDDKAMKLAASPRKPGEPNPWVLGVSGYLRYMMVNLEVAQTVRAMMIEAGVK
jgi:metallo-beta-lactamase class B